MKKTSRLLCALVLICILICSLVVFASAKTPDSLGLVAACVDNTKFVKGSNGAPNSYYFTKEVVSGGASYTYGSETVNYNYLKSENIDYLDELIAGNVEAAGDASVFSNGGKYYRFSGGACAEGYYNKFSDGKVTRDYDYVVFSINVANDGKLGAFKLHGKGLDKNDKGEKGSGCFMGGFSFDEHGVLTQNKSIAINTDPFVWNKLTLVIEVATGLMKLYVNDVYAAQVDFVKAGQYLYAIQDFRIELSATVTYDTKGTADTSDDVRTAIRGGDIEGAGFIFNGASLAAYTPEDGVGGLYNVYTDISDTYANGNKLLDVPTVADLPASLPTATVDGIPFYNIESALEYYYANADSASAVKLLRSVNENFTVSAPVVFDTEGKFTLAPTYDSQKLTVTAQGNTVTYAAKDGASFATVSFYLDGKLYSSTTATVGGTVTSPAAVDLGGRRIVGWATSQDGEAALECGAALTATESASYYAVLSTYAYKITDGSTVNYYTDGATLIENLHSNVKKSITVDIYSDITITANSGQVTIDSSNTHTINLHGADLVYNYKSCKFYQIGGSSSVVINGFADPTTGEKPLLYTTSNQLCGNYGTVRLEGLRLKCTNSSGCFVDFAGGTLYVTNCDIMPDSSGAMFAMRNTGRKLFLTGVTSSFARTVVSSSGTSHVVTLRDVTFGKEGTVVANADATTTYVFEGDVKLDCNGSVFNFNSTSTNTFNINGSISMKTKQQAVIDRLTEDKAVVDCVDGTYKVVDAEDAVTLTYVYGDNSYSVVIEKGAQVPSFNIPAYEMIDGKLYAYNFNGWLDENGNSVTVTSDKSATYTADATSALATLAVYNANGEIVYVTTDKEMSVTVTEKGYRTELYSDITLTHTAAEYGVYSDRLIELNGYTLTKTTFRFNTYSKNFTLQSTSEDRAKINNGTRSVAFGYGNVLFKNLESTSTGTVHFMDFRSSSKNDKVTIDNCHITTGACAIVLGQSSKEGSVVIKDSVLVSQTGISFNQHFSNVPAYMIFTVDVTNTVFDNSSVPIATGAIPVGTEENPSKYTVNVTGCSFNRAPYKSSVPTQGIVYINYTDCRFAADPFAEDPQGVATVTYAQGQTLLTTDDAKYPYEIGKVTLPISSNLTLYSDFNLNLYLGNNATKVMVGDTELELEEYDANTVKASLKGISPNTAADNIVFAISYVDGGVTYTANFNYSVVKYATTLLAGNYSAESKALVASAVKYIDTAYAAAKAEKPATLTALIATEGYANAIATASDLAKGDIDGAGNYTALAVAINSAQLRLSDDYKYVLNLNESYTGTLKVNNVTYNVVNGTVNGKTYVTVTLRGYEFNNGLTVTATTADGTVEGTYTLADYVEAMANGTDADLDALLVALYNFTVEAKEYNDYAKTNGLK